MPEFNPGAAADLNQAVKQRYEANADTNAFSDAEKAKLAGIAAGATQNATDAALRDRATHTGTQAIASVTGLQTALDGKAAASHTHAIANVTGLQAALDAKAALAVAQSFTAAQGTSVVTLTDGATIATNASLSNQFKVTLGGNRTMGAPTNLVEGRVYEWEVKQDATGNRTLVWASVFKFPGGTAPTLQTASGASDIITARFNGTNLHCIHSGGWTA